MPSVWTRSSDELHKEYIANTEAFYRSTGRASAAELDDFMRKCALGLWKNSSSVAQSHVDAYNALYSKGREAPWRSLRLRLKPIRAKLQPRRPQRNKRRTA